MRPPISLGFNQTPSEALMEDPRCCGTGTCIINEQGYCWCGQKWDGTKMCFPEKPKNPPQSAPEPTAMQPAAQDKPV